MAYVTMLHMCMLQEYMTVCEVSDKPLVLLRILHSVLSRKESDAPSDGANPKAASSRVIIFASSVEATHRYRLP
mgnify:CR=1 FL=1